MEKQYILYGAKTGNCLRATVALEEAGIPYTVEHVALRQGEQKSAAFLALNPKGLVPMLIISEPSGKRTVLTESNAIMLHAAESRPESNLLGRDAEARMLVLERFFYFLTEAIAPSISGFRMKIIGVAEAEKYFNERIVTALSFADSFLNKNAYMAGNEFSLADAIAYTITAPHLKKLELSSLPKLRAWFERVGARPAIQRGMSRFG
jgi:GST-like protein